MSTMFWTASLINLMSAIGCGVLAHKKGRNVTGWVFAGIFFSWIALIVIAVKKPLKYS